MDKLNGFFVVDGILEDWEILLDFDITTVYATEQEALDYIAENIHSGYRMGYEIREVRNGELVEKR